MSEKTKACGNCNAANPCGATFCYHCLVAFGEPRAGKKTPAAKKKTSAKKK